MLKRYRNVPAGTFPPAPIRAVLKLNTYFDLLENKQIFTAMRTKDEGTLLKHIRMFIEYSGKRKTKHSIHSIDPGK